MSNNRLNFFKSLIIKEAASKQSIMNLGYPEIFATLFLERFEKNAFIIAKWVKEIFSDEVKSIFDKDPFYFGIVKSFAKSDSAVEELKMYLEMEKGPDHYYEYLKRMGFESSYQTTVEEDRSLLYDEIKDAFYRSSVFRQDLIKDVDSKKITDLSAYKKLNYDKASLKYMEKNIANEDNIIIKYDDGYKWVNLGKTCNWLGRKMKNCGSSGLTGLSFQSRILALLDESNNPHVILTHDTDINTASSIEGAASTSPKEKYNKYIVDLLKQLDMKFYQKTNKSKGLYIDFIFDGIDFEKELFYKDIWKEIYKITTEHGVFFSDTRYLLDEESVLKVYNYLDLKNEDETKKKLENAIGKIFSDSKDKCKELSEEVGVNYYSIDNQDGIDKFKNDKILKVGHRFIELLKISKKTEPKTGTGKKPKGSGRRLYTDENPKDTCSVSFTSVSAIRKTFSSSCFKSKPHARQSQIINLVHQRVRAAYRNAKDPKVKKRLKRALEYAEKRKESSKEKTKRLNKKKRSHLISDIFKFAIEESKKLNSKLAAIIENPNFLREYFEDNGEKEFYSSLESMFGTPIGEGGSRLAYLVDGFILKIAKAQQGFFKKAGLNGNKKEGQFYFKYPEFLPITLGYDKDGSWIIQEKLTPFETEEEFLDYYLNTFNSSSEIKNLIQSLGYSKVRDITYQCYVAYQRSYIYSEDFLNDAKGLFIGYYEIKNEDFENIKRNTKSFLEKDDKFLRYLDFIKESGIRLGEIGPQNSGYDKSGNFKIFDLSH